MLRVRVGGSAILVVLGCEAAQDVAQTSQRIADAAAVEGKTAMENAKASTQKVVEGSKGALESGKEAAKALSEEGGTLAEKTGALSGHAQAWLEDRARSGQVEALVVKGKTVAPVALEVGRVLGEAVDEQTVIEPIYRTIDAPPDEVDAAIQSMPRVEVVDGLTVGLERMDGLEGTEVVKGRGYLVMWRQDDRLVGFVYRSRRSIDLEHLVAEAPRLVRLTKTAVAAL